MCLNKGLGLGKYTYMFEYYLHIKNMSYVILLYTYANSAVYVFV